MKKNKGRKRKEFRVSWNPSAARLEVFDIAKKVSHKASFEALMHILFGVEIEYED